MTQLIGVVTPRSVLLAADRRVTSIATGAVLNDDTCKMVSVCNVAAIAYTGLAALDGIPTYEWICHRIVDVAATRVATAVASLERAATQSFSRLTARALYPHTFLLAGYDSLVKGGVQPHLAIITNTRDAEGRRLDSPSSVFRTFIYVKPPSIRLYAHFEGGRFTDQRRATLVRNLGRAYSRNCTDEPLLRLMSQAIVDSSKLPTFSVGERVLAMAIPEESLRQPNQASVLLTGPAAAAHATFGYFIPGVARVIQLGPAFACGGSALVDLETENDPARNYQSSSVRILRMPGAEANPPSYHPNGSRD